jgi:glycosyltransferase involved in cell wall biosynthesis
MHIGIDSRLPYYRMGGISQYTLHLIQALAERDNHNQYTILHSRKDKRSYLPAAANFRRADLFTPCHHRLERWSLSAEIVPRRLDLLHSPDFIPPAFGAQKRIITVHDLNFIFYGQFLTPESRRYYAGQIDWAVRVADHIMVDSHASRRDLIEQLGVPPEKVSTVHLAANPIYAQKQPEQAIHETLRRYHLPRDFILAVGTLEPRKNLPTLLHAYARLRNDSLIDVPLVLVGSRGWNDGHIFALIETLELANHVVHLAGIEDVQLAHLYRAAGVLALPSHYEGFGLPVLEAMHSGCPVMVSNRGSLPEVAGDAGMLLEPDDPELWAEALGQVLTYTEMQVEMVARGKSQARNFSWQKTAEATLRLYESI